MERRKIPQEPQRKYKEYWLLNWPFFFLLIGATFGLTVFELYPQSGKIDTATVLAGVVAATLMALGNLTQAKTGDKIENFSVFGLRYATLKEGIGPFYRIFGAKRRETESEAYREFLPAKEELIFRETELDTATGHRLKKNLPEGKVLPWYIQTGDDDKISTELAEAFHINFVEGDSVGVKAQRVAMSVEVTGMMVITVVYPDIVLDLFGEGERLIPPLKKWAERAVESILPRLTLITIKQNLLAIGELATYTALNGLMMERGESCPKTKTVEDIITDFNDLKEFVRKAYGFTFTVFIDEPEPGREFGVAQQDVAVGVYKLERAELQRQEDNKKTDAEVYDKEKKGVVDAVNAGLLKMEEGAGAASARENLLKAEGVGRAKAIAAMGGGMTGAEMYRIDAARDAATASKPTTIKLTGLEDILSQADALLGLSRKRGENRPPSDPKPPAKPATPAKK